MVTERDRVIELLQAQAGSDPEANGGRCDDGTYDHQWREADLGCGDCCDTHSGFSCDICMTSADAVWESGLYAAIGVMLRARK
jgi:hypothetical protein